MSEKQYRLNKWGTKLLKSNRPLFDWANESDDIVDLLNEQDTRIKELETRNKRQYEQLKELTELMCERQWGKLENMVEEWEKQEKLLNQEWSNCGDE